MIRNKLLLIGWDAADWKTISPLVDAGKMPHLQSMIERGVMGNLATIRPILSPMLWTSIATGKRPFKHGIHGFAEPDPHSGAIRPITNLARKTKAVWNILNQHGLRTNVVGWWPSHPAEPIHGVMVSNHFQQAPGDLDQPWPMRPGTVHPAKLASELAEWRIHPQELDGDMLRLFVPHAPEIDQIKDRRLYACAKIIAECSSIHAVAPHLLANTEWDFMAVYYDAIDHFGHGFMKYHPPKQEWVSQHDFDLYQDVIESGYRYHDLMLGTLLQLAGEDTTVILMSDHGFHPDVLRPRHLPNEPAGPAAEHRPYGVLAAMGPNIRRDELVFGSSILDICPTILAHFGLATGRDMDGRVLVSMFEQEPVVEYVDTWDEIDGPCDAGLHPPDTRLDPVEARAAIDQLVALGYIEAPDADKEVAVKETVRELQYNLARAYGDANYLHEARDVLQELWHDWPEESRFGVGLLNIHLALGQAADARQTLNDIKCNKEKYSRDAADELKRLLKEIGQKQEEEANASDDQPQRASVRLPGPERAEEPAAIAPRLMGDERKIDFSKLDDRTRMRLTKLRRQAGVHGRAFDYLEGLVLHAEHRFAEAVESFQMAATTEPSNLPTLLLKMGEAQLALRDFSAAEESFRRVLEFDTVNPQARLGLARVHFRQGHNDRAAAEAFASIGQLFHNPRAHLLAGLALNREGYVERAVECLETAIAQDPIYPLAHRSLASIYRLRLGDEAKAAEHYRRARAARERIRSWRSGHREKGVRNRFGDQPREQSPASEKRFLTPSANWEIEPITPFDPTRTITVVSGLPRSGTSMMMQMLAAGGMPILADDHRPADESNQKGYYELEKAKSLGPGAGKYEWLSDAQGKAVKLVAHLVPRLMFRIRGAAGNADAAHENGDAVDLYYRIILMLRPTEEVISSQQKMLARLGKQAMVKSPDVLAGTFQLQLNQVRSLLDAWNRHYPGRIALTRIDYHDALEKPAKIASRVNQFLGGGLDETAMAAAVDPNLRRERARE